MDVLSMACCSTLFQNLMCLFQCSAVHFRCSSLIFWCAVTQGRPHQLRWGLRREAPMVDLNYGVSCAVAGYL